MYDNRSGHCKLGTPGEYLNNCSTINWSEVLLNDSDFEKEYDSGIEKMVIRNIGRDSNKI